MPDPAQLAAAGPWAVVVAIGLALGIAFVRGWVVPRFAYDREAKRADDATAALVALTKSFETLTEDIREIRWSSRDGPRGRNASSR